MTPPASTEPMYLISESELLDLDGTSDDELIFNAVRARGPTQQSPAPTNHLAIPCPKCGKWIFRANVDEGYTLFCSDDECGWKQKIVAQQAPADNLLKLWKKFCKNGDSGMVARYMMRGVQIVVSRRLYGRTPCVIPDILLELPPERVVVPGPAALVAEWVLGIGWESGALHVLQILPC